MGFIDFKEVSKVPFRLILDLLRIHYEPTREGLKGQLDGTPFIVNEQKNLFLCPYNSDYKGGIINFWSIYSGKSLIESAKDIKAEFVDEKKPPVRQIPELKLEYCPFLRNNGISQATAEELEIGLCTQKSIMAGKICFRLYDELGQQCLGYFGYGKDGKPFVPNGFKHNTLFNVHRVDDDKVFVYKSPLEAAKAFSNTSRNVIGLTRESLTQEQEDILSMYKQIVFIGCSPATVMRMARRTFVMADDTDE